MFTPHLTSVHITSIQCSHHIHPVSTAHLPSVHITSTQCSHHIHPVFTSEAVLVQLLYLLGLGGFLARVKEVPDSYAAVLTATHHALTGHLQYMANMLTIIYT